jgi:hypothetical protein
LLDRFFDGVLNVLQAVFRTFVSFSRQNDAGKRSPAAGHNAGFDIRAADVDADEELLNALVPILRSDCSGHGISLRGRNCPVSIPVKKVAGYSEKKFKK